jgi:hypothetical protein
MKAIAKENTRKINGGKKSSIYSWNDPFINDSWNIFRCIIKSCVKGFTLVPSKAIPPRIGIM